MIAFKSNLYSVLLKSKICSNNPLLFGSKRWLSLGIISAPFSRGQSRDGVQLGPKAIREAGLLHYLKLLGHDVIDFGDFNNCYNINENNCNVINDKNALNDKLMNKSMVREMCFQLAPLVKRVVENDRIPITLGGDHSIAIGSICGNASTAANHEMCVVWVDAHADINTALTTNSGHFHGMPVSFLVKELVQKLNNPNKGCFPMDSIVKPCISASNIALIGLRDVESHEMDIINELNITYFSMKDIDKLGIYEVIARILDKINPNLKRGIHVSFDIDSVDQMLAPSTGTPVPAGLTLREALSIGEEIANTKLLCGLDLVEFNPLIGNQYDVFNTVNSALNIILSFFSKSRTVFAKNLK